MDMRELVLKGCREWGEREMGFLILLV